MNGLEGGRSLKERLWKIRRKIALRLVLGLLGENGRNHPPQNGPSTPPVHESYLPEGAAAPVNRRDGVKDLPVLDALSPGAFSVREDIPILPKDPQSVNAKSVPELDRQREIQPAGEGYITVFQKRYLLEFAARAIFAEIPWNLAIVEFSVKPGSLSPQESYLEITVRDPCTGRVLAQDGYGYKYSTVTRKRIRLPGSGSYHITLYGKGIEATLCLLVNGCQDKPVPERIARTTNTFILALKHCGLDKKIESGGKYTLFVPTDEAFMRLEEEKPGFLFQISSDKKSLSNILAYHILRGKFRREDLSVNGSHHSLLGPPPRIQKFDNRILVDGAVLSLPQIECESGIIHLVDRVLIPPGNADRGPVQSIVTGKDLHQRDDITIILVLIFLGVIIYGALVIAFP